MRIPLIPNLKLKVNELDFLTSFAALKGAAEVAKVQNNHCFNLGRTQKVEKRFWHNSLIIMNSITFALLLPRLPRFENKPSQNPCRKNSPEHLKPRRQYGGGLLSIEQAIMYTLIHKLVSVL